MLPPEFLDRLTEIAPADRLDDVIASFGARRRPALRVTPAGLLAAGVLESLRGDGLDLLPHAAADGAFTVPVEQRNALTHHPSVAAGLVYVQSLSSQLAGHVLSPNSGEEVLDLAAAPGGKTLHLAERVGRTGQIAAVESSRPRFFKLQSNLNRGVPGGGPECRTYLADGRTIGAKTPLHFDRVLLDAPCSSEARLDPADQKHDWSLRKVKRCAALQKQLLASALAACRPGGTVLYATCTIAPEENEAVIDEALRRHPYQLEVEHVELHQTVPAMRGLTCWKSTRFDDRLTRTARVLPDREHFTAFFLAKLRVVRPIPPISGR